MALTPGTRIGPYVVLPVTTDNPDRVRMLSVAVTDEPTVKLGEPVTLFETDIDNLLKGFDISPDGTSIVMPRPVPDQGNTPELRFVLVQHWLAEFTKR